MAWASSVESNVRWDVDRWRARTVHGARERFLVNGKIQAWERDAFLGLGLGLGIGFPRIRVRVRKRCPLWPNPGPKAVPSPIGDGMERGFTAAGATPTTTHIPPGLVESKAACLGYYKF